MKRRNLIFLLGGASSGAMSVGTGAFSSVKAERGVEVNVAGDTEAFVGYHTPDPSGDSGVSNGDRITLVEVRNRFSDSHEISLVGVQVENGWQVLDSDSYEVERKLPQSASEDFENVEHTVITEGSTEPSSVDAPDDGFTPGLYERVTAEVDGISPGDTVEVGTTVTVKGVTDTGFSARLLGDTRMFTLSGTANPTEASNLKEVKFPGNNGKVKIRSDESNQDGSGNSNRTVTASAYYKSDEGVKETEERNVRLNRSLGLSDFGSADSGPIVGVAIRGISGVAVHPEFDTSNCTTTGGENSTVAVGDDLPAEDDAFDNCLNDE